MQLSTVYNMDRQRSRSPVRQPQQRDEEYEAKKQLLLLTLATVVVAGIEVIDKVVEARSRRCQAPLELDDSMATQAYETQDVENGGVPSVHERNEGTSFNGVQDQSEGASSSNGLQEEFARVSTSPMTIVDEESPAMPVSGGDPESPAMPVHATEDDSNDKEPVVVEGDIYKAAKRAYHGYDFWMGDDVCASPGYHERKAWWARKFKELNIYQDAPASPNSPLEMPVEEDSAHN